MLALALLAIPPILTNTYVGMREVEREIVDSGRGMGMSAWRLIRTVELPLALPLILAGVRISAVNVVATATIAPLAGFATTLGDPIINAGVYGDEGRVGAAMLVALVAIATELVFAAAQRAVTPEGVKLSRGTTRRRSNVINKKLNLETISDLKGQEGDLKLYGSPECRQRRDCLLGLQEVYDLDVGSFTPVDIAQRHEVLKNGDADVSIVFTTDPQNKRDGLVLLRDDKGMFRRTTRRSS